LLLEANMGCNHKVYVKIIFDAVHVDFNMFGPIMSYHIIDFTYGWLVIKVELPTDVNLHFKVYDFHL